MDKIKQLSEYTIEELQYLLSIKARQVGTMGSLMIVRELLTRDIKQ